MPAPRQKVHFPQFQSHPYPDPGRRPAEAGTGGGGYRLRSSSPTPITITRQISGDFQRRRRSSRRPNWNRYAIRLPTRNHGCPRISRNSLRGCVWRWSKGTPGSMTRSTFSSPGSYGGGPVRRCRGQTGHHGRHRVLLPAGEFRSSCRVQGKRVPLHHRGIPFHPVELYESTRRVIDFADVIIPCHEHESGWSDLSGKGFVRHLRPGRRILKALFYFAAPIQYPV